MIAARPGVPARRAAQGPLAVAVVAALMLAPAGAAQAHPLGNFTVNHYNGLTLTPEHISVLSVVDSAELPTQQVKPEIDADADDALSAVELADHAGTECTLRTETLRVDVDGAPLDWQVLQAQADAVPGQAGLPTLRVTCVLRADVDLASPKTVTFTDDTGIGRIGWREITAVGDGVRLPGAPVPPTSTSDELRSYPEDLLSSPLDVRSVTLSAEPGTSDASEGPALVRTPAGDPLSRLVTAGDRALDDLIGRATLTPLVGALAVLLAVLLGAGHAILPGHGKTVMAAYLAGRRGRPRDAVLVGATVTATHTAGVLALGLLLTASTAIAGEQALRVLGIVSGVLITAVGVYLLRDAMRDRRAIDGRRPALATTAGQGHGHGHGDDHTHGDDHAHGHGHEHAHGHGHSHGHGPGRRGLLGIGVAGGLVPSPSALIILLGSVALGRTVFGVLLVLAYGAGMAGTLTAVGLLLVRVRGRLDRFEGAGGGLAAKVLGWLPAGTALLVLLVGVGLVLRGLLFGP